MQINCDPNSNSIEKLLLTEPYRIVSKSTVDTANDINLYKFYIHFSSNHYRSFKLKVVMTKPKETYVYAVKKLPEPINVDRVCYKVFTDHCCLELQVNKSFLFVHAIQFVIFCISDLTKG